MLTTLAFQIQGRENMGIVSDISFFIEEKENELVLRQGSEYSQLY